MDPPLGQGDVAAERMRWHGRVVVTALAALVVAACVVRLVLCALGIRAIIKLPRLQAVPVPASLRWPRVSVLMPACNEVADLPRALASRRHQDYPDLEVIAIDDRSTDGTAELLDEAAAADPRLRVVHIRSLPEGWLGKVHALHEGMTHATGEWVLLTDADVELAPGTVRRAVAYASGEGLDFLTALPTLAPVSFLVDVAMTDLIRTLLPLLQPDRVRDSRSGLAVGGGAFMLVRRTAYERTPGLQWLRLEVVDDMAFGQMMKASGAQCAVANGAGWLGVRRGGIVWRGTLYRTEVLRAGMRYRPLRQIPRS